MTKEEQKARLEKEIPGVVVEFGEMLKLTLDTGRHIISGYYEIGSGEGSLLAAIEKFQARVKRENGKSTPAETKAMLNFLTEMVEHALAEKIGRDWEREKERRKQFAQHEYQTMC